MLFKLLDILPFIVNHFVLVIFTQKENRKLVGDQYFYGAIFGLLGARITYILLHLSNFSGSWFSIINPVPYNLNLFAGIIVSLLVVLLLARKSELSFERSISNYTFGFYTLFFMISLVAYIKGIVYPLSLMSGSDNSVIIMTAIYLVAAVVDKLLIKDVRFEIGLFLLLVIVRVILI